MDANKSVPCIIQPSRRGIPCEVKPKFPVPHATTQLTNISPKSLIETPEKVINYYLN